MTSSEFYAPSGYYLDVTFSSAALQSLYESGQMVGIVAQTEIPRSQVQPILTQAWNPLEVNDVHFGTDFGVYFTKQQALMPGMIMQIAGETQAMLGQTVTLNETFEPPVTGGVPGAVTIVSGADTSATYVGGLAQITVSGMSTGLNPASAAALPPGIEVLLSPTNVIRILLVDAGTESGQVLSNLALNESTAVGFSADESTQTASYNPSTGRFDIVD